MDCLWEGDGSREIRGYLQDRCHWGSKEVSQAEVVTLLERFKENPEETRQAARVGIDWYNSMAV